MQTMDTEPVSITGSLEATLWNPQQAAQAAGVTPGLIALWAHRGYLARVNPGVRTPMYRAVDVLKAEHDVRMRRERLAVAA